MNRKYFIVFILFFSVFSVVSMKGMVESLVYNRYQKKLNKKIAEKEAVKRLNYCNKNRGNTGWELRPSLRINSLLKRLTNVLSKMRQNINSEKLMQETIDVLDEVSRIDIKNSIISQNDFNNLNLDSEGTDMTNLYNDPIKEYKDLQESIEKFKKTDWSPVMVFCNKVPLSDDQFLPLYCARIILSDYNATFDCDIEKRRIKLCGQLQRNPETFKKLIPKGSKLSDVQFDEYVKSFEKHKKEFALLYPDPNCVGRKCLEKKHYSWITPRSADFCVGPIDLPKQEIKHQIQMKVCNFIGNTSRE